MPPYCTRSTLSIPNAPVGSINESARSQKRSKSPLDSTTSRSKPTHVYGKRLQNAGLSPTKQKRESPPPPPAGKAKVKPRAKPLVELSTDDEGSSDGEEESSSSSEASRASDATYVPSKKAKVAPSRRKRIATPESQDGSSDLSEEEDDNVNGGLKKLIESQSKTKSSGDIVPADAVEPQSAEPTRGEEQRVTDGKKRKAPSRSPSPSPPPPPPSPVTSKRANPSRTEQEGEMPPHQEESRKRAKISIASRGDQADPRVADAISFGLRRFLQRLADNMCPEPLEPSAAASSAPSKSRASVSDPAQSRDQQFAPSDEKIAPEDKILTEESFSRLWRQHQVQLLRDWEAARLRLSGHVLAPSTNAPTVSSDSSSGPTTGTAKPVPIAPVPNQAFAAQPLPLPPIPQRPLVQQFLSVSAPTAQHHQRSPIAPNPAPKDPSSPAVSAASAARPRGPVSESAPQVTAPPSTPGDTIAAAAAVAALAPSLRSTVARFKVLSAPATSLSVSAPQPPPSSGSGSKEGIHIGSTPFDRPPPSKTSVLPPRAHQPSTPTPLRASHTPAAPYPASASFKPSINSLLHPAGPSATVPASPSPAQSRQPEQSWDRHSEALDVFASEPHLPPPASSRAVSPPLPFPAGLNALMRQNYASAGGPSTPRTSPAVPSPAAAATPRGPRSTPNGTGEGDVRNSLAKYAYVPPPPRATATSIGSRPSDHRPTELSIPSVLPESAIRQTQREDHRYTVSPDSSPEPGEIVEH